MLLLLKNLKRSRQRIISKGFLQAYPRLVRGAFLWESIMAEIAISTQEELIEITMLGEKSEISVELTAEQAYELALALANAIFVIKSGAIYESLGIKRH